MRLLIIGAGQVGREILKRLKQSWQITVIDHDEKKLKSIPDLLDSETLNRTVLLQGDGTSRLILKRAGIQEAKVLVACTGDDEANLEICRIAKEFLVPSIYAVSNHMEHDRWFEREGINFVNKAVATASVLETQIESGIIAATNIGLGQGEIVEVAILPTSILAGYPVGKFTTKRWRVAAIFRGRRLVLPKDSTVIRPGDRILLVGDPAVLKHIVGLISSGESQFPLQFGSEEVIFLPEPDENVMKESCYIREIARVSSTVVYPCFGDAEKLNLSCHPRANVVPLSQCKREFISKVVEREPGIIIFPPYGEVPLAVGMRTFPLEVAEMLLVPVLMARGTTPYRKVLVPISGSFSGYRALEIGIEIALQSKSKLDAVFVSQTESSRKVDDLRDRVRKLSSLYGINIELKVKVGNVVNEVSKLSSSYDLLVVGGRKGIRSSWFNPYPPYYMFHRAKCSSLFICTGR